MKTMTHITASAYFLSEMIIIKYTHKKAFKTAYVYTHLNTYKK